MLQVVIIVHTLSTVCFKLLQTIKRQLISEILQLKWYIGLSLSELARVLMISQHQTENTHTYYYAVSFIKAWHALIANENKGACF